MQLCAVTSGSTWTTSAGSPNSVAVYRGYTLSTPGSVSSAACNADRSGGGRDPRARSKNTSFEAYGEDIDASVTEERRGTSGCKNLATTQQKMVHVAAVQTCGPCEHVRLSLCSAARHAACSALCSRVLLSVRCGATLCSCVPHALAVTLLLSDRGMRSA